VTFQLHRSDFFSSFSFTAEKILISETRRDDASALRRRVWAGRRRERERASGTEGRVAPLFHLSSLSSPSPYTFLAEFFIGLSESHRKLRFFTSEVVRSLFFFLLSRCFKSPNRRRRSSCRTSDLTSCSTSCPSGSPEEQHEHDAVLAEKEVCVCV